MRSLLLTLFACFASTISFDSAIAQSPGSTDLGAIWFVGDSITQSNADGDSSGSPRSELFDLLSANGYSFSYTGSRTNNTEGLPVTGSTNTTNLFHFHSGISGSVIGANFSNRTGMTQNLPSQWNSGRLASVKPDIILIMLGTNDIDQGIDITNAPSRLSNYIDQIYNQPGVGDPRIFVASIPPNRRTTQEAIDVMVFNSTVPGIVSAQQALGRDVAFVDQFTPLDDNFATLMRSDNLHTNAAGNASLAQQWFDCITGTVFVPPQSDTVYIGDAASEGQNVLEGDDGYSLAALTIVNLSDGNSAAPVIYTAPMEQTLELTEVNFFTANVGGGSGNLIPFVVRILGAAANGSFNGQLASSYEILAVGDAIAADANTLINGAFTVNGFSPTISLDAGDRIAAGFLSDSSRLVAFDNPGEQGVAEYINSGDSLTGATNGTLTSNSDFNNFDRSLSFNIGFVVEGTALLGDFDMDGNVDLSDLDRYIGNIGAQATGDLAELDLDGNGTVDPADFEQHFGQLVQAGDFQGTFAGDTNLDGVVDVLDDAFTLISNLGNNMATSWSQGDFNGDRSVDVIDDAFALVGNLGQSNTP